MDMESIEDAARCNALDDISLVGINERAIAMKHFVNGAQWRISSVWHNIDNELPECGKHVVNEDWFDFIAKDEKDLQRIIKKYPFKLWAYVSDLLPDCVKHDEK